jgi:hypothetical protein
MVKYKDFLIVAAVIIAVVIVGFIGTKNDVEPKDYGRANESVRAEVASSTQVTGAGVVTLYASSTQCVSRAISTGGQAIMLSFNADLAPSPTVGHVQSASTTVNYDSGLYGCPVVKAYSFGSSVINLTEFR